MTIALVIFASLLAFAAIGSAVSKLKKVPNVITSLTSVGVKENQIPVLAWIEIAGGLGVIAGIWVPMLGLAASIGIALYFAGAVASHIKAKHGLAESGAAVGILVISIITTALQLQR